MHAHMYMRVHTHTEVVQHKHVHGLLQVGSEMREDIDACRRRGQLGWLWLTATKRDAHDDLYEGKFVSADEAGQVHWAACACTAMRAHVRLASSTRSLGAGPDPRYIYSPVPIRLPSGSIVSTSPHHTTGGGVVSHSTSPVFHTTPLTGGGVVFHQAPVHVQRPPRSPGPKLSCG